MKITTLEDLYYGNISPHERYTKCGSRVDQLVKLIRKNEESLTAGLTEQRKETFEKFKDRKSELQDCRARCIQRWIHPCGADDGRSNGRLRGG